MLITRFIALNYYHYKLLILILLLEDIILIHMTMVIAIQSAQEGATILTEQATQNASIFNAKDIFDILFQLFITVCGFIFALWNERRHEEKKNREETAELKKLLKDELQRIQKLLEKLDVTYLESQPIKIPMWESVISTGHLALLDFSTREELFRVYNRIKEYNSWANIYTNYYFEKGEMNQLVLNELVEIKKSLLGEISSDKEGSESIDISNVIELL